MKMLVFRVISPKIKIPELKISKFDGDVINWQTFWQQFESAIHLNETLDNINKFNYLLQYLCEEARSSISGLSITSETYLEAIDLLKQRYGNTQILISAYTKKLVLLPMIRGDNDIQGLRLLHDQIECSMRNLRSLDVDISTYGVLLVPLVTEKLPNNLRLLMSRKFKNDKWDIKTMLEILKEELEAKERSVAVGSSFHNQFEKEYSTSALYQNTRKFQKKPCVFCNKNNHTSNRCLQISEPSARKTFVKDNKLCFLCLEKGHSVKSCTLSYSCHKCKGKHNIAICTHSKEADSSSTNLSSNSNNILLKTATAAVSNYNNPGNIQNAQVIFDCASQRSYISEKLRQSLKLPKIRTENIVINVFANSKSSVRKVDIVPVQFNCGDKTIVIECISTPFLCLDIENQNLNVAVANYPHLQNLTLADSSPDGKKNIEILVGADYYYRFIYGNIIRGKVDEPVAVESCLGWLVSDYFENTNTFVNFNSTHVL